MTLGYKTEDFDNTRLAHVRNATIPIGCACVTDATSRITTLTQHFAEKRSERTKRGNSPKLKTMKRHLFRNLN